MAISAATSVTTVSQTTASLTIVGTVGATFAVGTCIVVNEVHGSGTVTATIADSKSNTWALVPGAPSTNSSGAVTSTYAWVSILTTALVSGDTITVTRSSSTGVTGSVMIINAHTGVFGTSSTAIGNTENASVTTASNSPSLSSMSISNGSIVYYVIGTSSGVTANTPTSGNGFANDQLVTATSDRTGITMIAATPSGAVVPGTHLNSTQVWTSLAYELKSTSSVTYGAAAAMMAAA